MRMRSKVIRGESLCGTVADATCETAADAACENCSTITTVKRPTTKCPTICTKAACCLLLNRERIEN